MVFMSIGRNEVRSKRAFTPSDIAGAKAIGMYAVRLAANYDDANRSVKPDAVVNSYAEFEEWLERQG